MLTLHRQPASVESNQSPRDPQDWVVRVPANFLDARRTGLSDRGRALVQILGSFARDKAYCWPSLATLSQWTGKDERNVRKILGELEGSWTRRVYDATGRLVGIVLLRRAESDMPAADTPERVAAAERALRQAARGRYEPNETVHRRLTGVNGVLTGVNGVWTGVLTPADWSPQRGTKSSGARGTKSSAELGCIPEREKRNNDTRENAEVGLSSGSSSTGEGNPEPPRPSVVAPVAVAAPVAVSARPSEPAAPIAIATATNLDGQQALSSSLIRSGPASPPVANDPAEVARLKAKAERLFPMLELGRKVDEVSGDWPAAWIGEALDTAHAVDVPRWPYVLGILRNYRARGGPDLPRPGQRSEAHGRSAPAPPPVFHVATGPRKRPRGTTPPAPQRSVPLPPVVKATDPNYSSRFKPRRD